MMALGERRWRGFGCGFVVVGMADRFAVWNQAQYPALVMDWKNTIERDQSEQEMEVTGPEINVLESRTVNFRWNG
jgi:hypothetical protein